MFQIVKKILLFLKVDWIDTIRINLFHLPFHQGRKFPILLFKAKLSVRHGAQIELRIPDEDCHFGILKLECCYVKNVISTQGIQIDLRTGKLIFGGSGIIGNGSNIITRCNGVIELGHNISAAGNLAVTSFHHIHVGNDVSCSWNVSIYDTDFHQLEDMIMGKSLKMTKDVFIGDNCWICQKSTILKGTRLPDWSIVGACSLVNKDFSGYPSGSTFVGSPVTVLSKRLIRSDQKIIDKFPRWCKTKGLTLLNRLPQ